MKYGHIQYIKLKLLILISEVVFFFILSGIFFYLKNQQLSILFALCMLIPIFFKRALDNYCTREIIINPTADYIDFTIKKHEYEEGDSFRINFNELAGYRISEYGPKFMNITFILKKGKNRSLTFLRQKQTNYDEAGDKIVNNFHELIKQWNLNATSRSISLKPSFMGTPIGLFLLTILFFLFADVVRTNINYGTNILSTILMLGFQISLWSMRIQDIRTYKKMK